MNRKNYDSGLGESTALDSENLRGINTNNIKTNNIKTNIINAEPINPKSDEDLLLIKEKCNLNEFTK